MKGLSSDICYGCIAGITGAIVLVSIVATLLFNVSFTVKELFLFYGLAALLGIIIGAIAGWLKCYRCQSDQNHHTR